MQSCFLSWIKTIAQLTQGEVIAIDGKTLRHSYDKGKNKGAIHMVSAWASQNSLVLGQVKVNEKSNQMQRGCALRRLRRLEGFAFAQFHNY